MSDILQLKTSTRDANNDQLETDAGTSPKLRVYDATAMPADTAASVTGTQRGEGTLPSDWMGASSSGTKSKSGTWTVTISGADSTGLYYWRLYDNAGTTCYQQGRVRKGVQLTTSASTSANGNVLTFTSTSGVEAGQEVAGTNIPDGTTVLAVTATTATLSQGVPGGVSNGATISFGDLTGTGSLRLPSLTPSNGSVITISTWSYVAGNA